MGFVSSEKIILENKRGEARAACEQSAMEYPNLGYTIGSKKTTHVLCTCSHNPCLLPHPLMKHQKEGQKEKVNIVEE